MPFRYGAYFIFLKRILNLKKNIEEEKKEIYTINEVLLSEEEAVFKDGRIYNPILEIME